MRSAPCNVWQDGCHGPQWETCLSQGDGNPFAKWVRLGGLMVIDSLVGAAWLSSAVFPVQRCQDGSKEVAVRLHTSPARRNPKKQVVMAAQSIRASSVTGER